MCIDVVICSNGDRNFSQVNSGNAAFEFALIIDMVAPLSASKSNMTFLFRDGFHA